MSASDAITWARGLVGPAAFVWERSQPQFLANPPVPDPDRRRAEWAQRVGGGERGLFERYLNWEGIDAAAADRIISGVTLTDAAPTPPWAETLAALTEGLGEPEPQDMPDWRTGDPVPFEALWDKAAPVLWRLLCERAGDGIEGLGPLARETLLRQPLAGLADLMDRVLYAEFDAARSYQRAVDPFAAAGLFQRTVRDLLAAKLRPVFDSYPVAGRAAGTLVETWLDASAEFLQRLAADRADIAAAFPSAKGRVAQLQLGLSDRHRGGRFVAIAQFEGGSTVVYKPKSLATEGLYRDLLERLRSLGLDEAPSAPAVLERPHHGWVAAVVRADCEDAEAVARFYRRAGVHLMLFYLLGGSDLHHENVIAAGEEPVIVDMETLAHGRARYDVGGQVAAGTEAANAFFFDSVTRTGLLPRWELDARGGAFDLSGLGGGDVMTATKARQRRWKQLNSDGMRPDNDTRQSTDDSKPTPYSPPNQPRLADGPVALADHLDDVIDGFEAAYRLLQAHSKRLEDWRPIARLKTAPCRFIMRNTRLYAQLLLQAFTPGRMRDGFDASMPVEGLARALLMEDLGLDGAVHPLWSVLQAERREMAGLDIPVIGTEGDSDALFLTGARAEHALQQPPFARILANIRRLSDADRAQQVAYTRAAFAAASPSAPPDMPNRFVAIGQGEGGPDLWARAADVIARDIAAGAFRGSSGDAWWLSVMYYDRAQRWQVQPMVARFYDGASGTALFLAAHAAVTGNVDTLALATGTLNGFIAGLDQTDFRRSLFEGGIGAGLGAGSMVYALAHCAVLLDRPDALVAAGRLLGEITDERIAADSRLDLLGGAAGAILVAHMLHDHFPDEAMRVVCSGADHLLAQRMTMPDGGRAWPGLGSRPLVGLTHGAAGMAVALTRAAELTGVSAYAEAAGEALTYERSTYDQARGGWPDYRFAAKAGEEILQRNWCNGSAGIGLSRLMLGAGDAGNRADLDRAVALTLGGADGDQLDHLCCGAMGRAVFLREAGAVLDDTTARTAGDAILDDVALAGLRSGYRLGWPAALSVPSFHQGTAGIGYTLLRAAYPGAHLPQIAAFDPPRWR